MHNYIYLSLVELKFADNLGGTVTGVKFTTEKLIFVPGFFCQLIVELCNQLSISERNYIVNEFFDHFIIN